MDLSPVSRDLQVIAKTAAEKWREESERRSDLRKELRPHVKDARRAYRAARRSDPTGKSASTHRAQRELNKAKAAVPDTLPVLSAKAVIGTVVAARVIGPAVPDQVWPWVVLGAASAAAGGLVWLVRRWWPAGESTGLVPTEEERRLLSRLAPEFWAAHREERGLRHTITGVAELTESGITCPVRLDHTWTPPRFADAEQHVRALLGARTGLRIEITPGDRGGWSLLTLRTRTAVDGTDLRWTPARRGIGLDAHSGRPVEIPLYTRLLLAGSSGAGKSVTLRPALAEVAADPLSAIVMVDLKRVEGALWRSRARIARTPDEVVDVAAELAAEMMARLEELESTGRASWTPTQERPRLVVLVDEGAEVRSAAKDALGDLESIARMGRAAEIHLWWCTQKPTMSGPSAGIPPQIAAQMDMRLSLRLASATEVRTVLGEDATAEGWDAHRLPKPGVLLIRGTGRGPVPVRVWYMDDAAVRALPAAPVWRRDAAPAAGGPVLSLVKPLEVAAPSGHDATILRFVQEAGAPVRQKDVVEQLGIPKGSVSKSVARLVKAGHITRTEDGALVATGSEEASA